MLDDLSGSQRKLLEEILIALKSPIKSTINQSSDICSPSFTEDFQNRLVLYHALNDDPLKKKAFEFAFAKSSRSADREAYVNTNDTDASKDVVVDGVGYSLKTEAAKNISRTSITISKLMEARWIRECQDGSDFIQGIKSRVLVHLKKYDRIIMLRALRVSDELIEYRLVEIPREILLAMDTIQPSDFSPRSSNGSSAASVCYGNTEAYKVSLDGSVEKVTIRNLLESLCTVHGTWIVPIRGESQAS